MASVVCSALCTTYCHSIVNERETQYIYYYIPKLSCICWHTAAGVKKVEQVMQEEVVFRNRVAQSHTTSVSHSLKKNSVALVHMYSEYILNLYLR